MLRRTDIVFDSVTPAVMSRKSWIEETFFKRECVKFIASPRDVHRCVPVCQVCLNLVRCCCGRLMGEHSSENFTPPLSLIPGPGSDTDKDWCMERHSRATPTDAYGIVDFEDTATRVCRAKYLRLAVDSKPEAIFHLMLKEWQMERPKLLLSVQGGSENFSLSPKVEQAFSKGLMTAALSTGAWILTNGINTGVSKYVGKAVKLYGGHDLRKRNTVGITPWGVIDNNADLIGRDVFRPYQPLGNPLSKRACLNGFHSHFLFVDDGTLGKHGCHQGLRRELEKHINLQKIHPRLNLGVPVVCVVLEGDSAVVSTVLHYLSRVPPVPVFVFEGSGRAADLLAFLHKQTATDNELEAHSKEDILIRIGQAFAVDRSEASHLYSLLLKCMEHRQCITIYDSESEDNLCPDAAILTATMKGTKGSPSEQLRMALAWDRADIVQKNVFVHGQQWQVGSLEQTMLDALVMDRVSFVKLLIHNGMTMSHFLTVDRLEELYNTHTQGQMKRFIHHLVEDVMQTSLPLNYRLSIIDMGLVIEYLIGEAYRSSYTRKHFRAAYNHLQNKGAQEDSSLSKHRQRSQLSIQTKSSQSLNFFTTAQPYTRDSNALPERSQEIALPPAFVPFNFNDLFVWAVLQQRQQMALFLWQHGEEALARATVACKLYRSMAFEARQSSMDENISERFRTYSLEFGQLAVDVLDCAFRQNEQMAMKLLTSEMEGWSHFTCLQMAISSGHRPFVSHSCTQTLLTDLWTGSLNMSKNSFLKIILSLLLPPFILMLEFKSKAEMCHVPQSHEAMLFEYDSVDSVEKNNSAEQKGSDNAASFHGSCPLSGTFSSLSHQCRSWVTRIYKFYTAPVVKFWFHTMSYLAFLMFFSYTVLVKMGDQPSAQEWLVIAVVFSTGFEKIREVFMSEPRKLSQKLKIWFSEYWNLSDFIAIILFVFGFLLRWFSDPFRTAGRICYCLDIIFWFIRVMDLLAVNQHAGPYLTMITKMTRNMFFIVVMMAIVLLSFGVSRKSILSPNEEPSWRLARDIMFQPYWMIYGEVYASEIDACDDDKPCAPASFLNPFLQAVYMFVQYIIMVNILIAFFNNIYFDMASTSNKLWKYNRYRYIMTYQDRPWLPPPLIFLSHLALVSKVVFKRLCGDAEREERGSGLKLYLGFEDRKKLHEFEEKCVETYFLGKKRDLGDQANAIKATAERTEEMVMMVGDVSDKVQSIQDSLSDLDIQLGQLQDLSVLAVDTLKLLSASDSLHQEEARLGQCQSLTSSHLVVPHSLTLPQRNEADLVQRKACKSTPSSLLMDRNVGAGRRISQECHRGAGQATRGHTNREVCHSPLIYPSSRRESLSGVPQENVDFSENCSSKAVVLSEPKNISDGLINPGFYSDGNQPSLASRPSRQWKSLDKHPGWSRQSRDHPYAYCRSLSSSVENITFSGKSPNPERGSFFYFDEPVMEECLSIGNELQATSGRKWSKSSDFTEGQSHYKKTVKIQESLPHNKTMLSDISEACWRRRKRFKGESRCWSASTSLSQLNLEPMYLLQRQMDLRSPTHSAWNCQDKSVRRSSVQSVIANEVRTSFQSSENLYPHYSAMERNNLMRLAHNILFTPVSLMGGEKVIIYSLEEEPSGSGGSYTVPSWSSKGLFAVLLPLSSEEGSLYGGLRRGSRVLCTWAEQDVLRPGQVYVVKAFHQEVVNAWEQYFPDNTALQLCLREIQQQRAAQKMMEVFNQIKPDDMHYSPLFLDVQLVHWHSNGQWLTIERNISGDFRKFNNNTGEEIRPCCWLEEMLLAFSHWTYEYSRREMLVLDLQGVGEELTDPTVIMADNHSGGRDEMLFGADNLGKTTISGFLHKHTCNACCQRLSLTNLRSHTMGRRERSTEESTSANEEKSIDEAESNL